MTQPIGASPDRDGQGKKAGGSSGIGWPLWAVASALPWLLPTHSDPWTTIYSELLIGAVMLITVPRLLFASELRWEIDFLSTGFLAAALVPLLQGAFGLFGIPAEAPLVSLYLVAISMIFVVARQWEKFKPGRMIDALFTGLSIAAVISTILAIVQWLRLDLFGILANPMFSDDRAIANVGQPNNLSTLLVWGLVGLWWAHSRRRLGHLGTIFGAAFLLTGIVLTQSRTGMLGVAFLCAVSFFGRRTLRTSPQVFVWFGLAAWFVVLTLALQPVSTLLFGTSTRSPVDGASPQERMTLLHMILTAIGRHPWVGYGWDQIVTAHVGLASEFPMHVLVGNSHNVILDLAIWNGIPLATLMILGLGVWFWHMLRAQRSAEQLLLLIGLGVFFLHAMLELPHVLAYFLFPAAVMMGTLNRHRPIRAAFSVPRAGIAVAALATAAVLVVVFHEYGQIETASTEARMRQAHFSHAPNNPEPNIFVLQALQDGLLTLRTEPHRDMSVSDLEHFRRVVTRYPTTSGLFRYAQSAALNGRDEDAAWALRTLCSLHKAVACQQTATEWNQLSALGNPELRAVVPPAP